MKELKRNNAKRLLACGMSAGVLMSCVACGGNEDDWLDPNRTQIYVAATSEGVNESWLPEIIEGFEKAYPEYQIGYDGLSMEDTKNLDTTIAGAKYDLYFIQSVALAENMAKKGLIDDISDVVTVGDPNFESGTTIESKMSTDYQEQYKYTKADGTEGYYGLPYVTIPFGITYDADLFTKKNLYNLTAYKGLDCVEGSADDCWGPDGKENTYDDGLPATWEDFKVMMNAMRTRGVTPFVWSGEHTYYRYYMLFAMIANYEGVDDFRMYFELDGTDSFSGEEISIENGYKLVERPSHKAALTMAYDIVSNPNNYSSVSFLTGTTHLQAQNTYILSERTSQPIAMLLDGVWWEHEAKATFAEMADEYGSNYGYGKRNFKFMPLPKFVGTEGVIDQKNMDTVLYDQNGNSLVCLNASSKQKEGAKLFLRYVHTNESLKKFTLNNGLIRPYDYDFSNDEYNQLAPFARSVWEIWKDETTKIASPVIFNERIYMEEDYVRGMLVSGKKGSTNYADPFDAFYANSNLTVAKYLEYMGEKYSASEWKKYMID